MRWGQRRIIRDGDLRSIKRFLFFPRCIYGECRWLEVAGIMLKRMDGKWKDSFWREKNLDIK